MTDTLTDTRYNKYLKNLLRNGKNPCVTLANSVAIDIAASYLQLYPLIKYDVARSYHHTCGLQRKVNIISSLHNQSLSLTSVIFMFAGTWTVVITL